MLLLTGIRASWTENITRPLRACPVSHLHHAAEQGLLVPTPSPPAWTDPSPLLLALPTHSLSHPKGISSFTFAALGRELFTAGTVILTYLQIPAPGLWWAFQPYLRNGVASISLNCLQKRDRFSTISRFKSPNLHKAFHEEEHEAMLKRGAQGVAKPTLWHTSHSANL